jgi:hypothetical protein
VPLENVLSRGEPAEFFEMVSGGADGWDGSEPLRRVES